MSRTVLGLFMRPVAWAPEALIEAGIESRAVRTWIADGPRAVPERARLSLRTRKRTEPTRTYVWGPDLRFLAGEK